MDVALTASLTAQYFAGLAVQEPRVLYYAARWHWNFLNTQLPEANAARLGFARLSRSRLTDPVTWEETLLRAVSVLTLCFDLAPKEVLARVAIGFLLAFDVFSRRGEMTGARRSELRPPTPGIRGQFALWTLTLFPEDRAPTSKTGRQDDTVVVGSSDPARAWIAKLMPLLASSKHPGPLLLAVSQSLYDKIYKQAGVRAGLPPSTPHQMRHGGASVDAINSCSDMSLLERGRWASTMSLKRYRRPAKYLRRLALLSAAQKRSARTAPAEIMRLASGILGSASASSTKPSTHRRRSEK